MEKEIMNKNIGHNMPPKTLGDFFIIDGKGNSTGRIKLTNTIIKKYLKRRYDKIKDKYFSVSVGDSEKPGLRARANTGGGISFYFVEMPKGKKLNGKRFNPVYHTLGNFPEISIDGARKFVEELKQAIKLGKDPRSIIEERRKAKKLSDVVAEWKTNVLLKAARFAKSTIKDTENRLKIWIDLESFNPRTNKIILDNKSDLNIGNKKMVEITKTDLIAWHAAISKSGEYQANRCVDDLKVIFKWAVEQKIIKENICKFTKDELNTEYKRLEDVDPYSLKEWRALRRAAIKLIKKNPKILVACMGILLAMYTGRRYKSEIFSLKWGQVDWDANKVRLPKTKTGKSEFSINRLSRWVLNSLWKHKIKTFKGKKLKSVKAGYLFPSCRKSKLPYMQDVRKTWIKICNLANVRVEEIYLLRHTWGCLALEATNGNIKAVKDEGGWKTFEMVEIYSKYNEKKLQKHSQVIGNFLARATA
jgi:integrase